MPWYVPVASPAALDDVLACSWTATPSGRHRLVPDGCVELLWLSRGEIWLCGPETTAWDFALPDDITGAGVRFRPGVAPAVLQFSAATVRDKRLPLRHLIGVESERDLLNRLGRGADLHARCRTLEQFVAEMADRHVDPDAFAERVLNMLASSPHANAGQLAVQLGMTTRQLLRRSLHSFGYGTSTLARLLRFQRFLAIDDCARHPRRLAELAIDAGYTDQAHLARDCRAITGQTPTAFLADYFPTFPDMSDPYKTVESFATTMST